MTLCRSTRSATARRIFSCGATAARRDRPVMTYVERDVGLSRPPAPQRNARGLAPIGFAMADARMNSRDSAPAAAYSLPLERRCLPWCAADPIRIAAECCRALALRKSTCSPDSRCSVPHNAASGIDHSILFVSTTSASLRCSCTIANPNRRGSGPVRRHTHAGIVEPKRRST